VLPMTKPVPVTGRALRGPVWPLAANSASSLVPTAFSRGQAIGVGHLHRVSSPAARATSRYPKEVRTWR